MMFFTSTDETVVDSLLPMNYSPQGAGGAVISPRADVAAVAEL